jgi:hypothetical protein
MNKKTGIVKGNGDLNSLIRQLEELVSAVEHSQAMCNTMFDAIRRECNHLINDAKIRLPENGPFEVNSFAWESSPLNTVPIEDRKLKNAWLALAQYRDGATAEDIMRDLKRHRTTVSTYLNQLVLLEFAKKERRGHEIYYRAVPYKDEGEAE